MTMTSGVLFLGRPLLRFTSNGAIYILSSFSFSICFFLGGVNDEDSLLLLLFFGGRPLPRLGGMFTSTLFDHSA